MNKLWIRLSIAFSSVVLIAVLIVALTGILLTQPERFVNFQDELTTSGGLVDELRVYYQIHQNWAGVEPLLIGARTTFRGKRMGDFSFFLADSNQQIISHPRGPNLVNQPMQQAPQIQILPINVNGRTVGYLGVDPPHGGGQPGAPRPPLAILSGFLLTLAGVGGLVGIISGILMSRTLTAPLRRLAEGARAIGARNLNQRVEVKGTDELKEVAYAFNEMAADLEKAEQLRRNLIADVAHELRTPLTVIQGNLRAMLDGVYELDKAEVARLYDQTRLLSRLVNDLHELAQAEADQLTLNLQETDLARLITTTGETFAPLAEEKGVELRTWLPDNLPLIQADPARLAQVLHNIISNALRHTPGGGSITVSVTPNASVVRLDITDTGDGIPPEHLPHVFDRFYRTDPARSRDKGGAGLGLAIARVIVEAHGGQISVASQGLPGRGATFTITLPRN